MQLLICHRCGEGARGACVIKKGWPSVAPNLADAGIKGLGGSGVKEEGWKVKGGRWKRELS